MTLPVVGRENKGPEERGFGPSGPVPFFFRSIGGGFRVEAFCANRYIPRSPTGSASAARYGYKPRFPHVEDGFDG